ncbi:MAG TPA: ATP-binding protein [Limnobacter sp.]|nr:ATP-binding protein [Limnobacter sp.]
MTQSITPPVAPGMVVFFCGKMGAGKSTLARHIAAHLGAVLLSEDQWLNALYPDEIQGLEDYIRCSRRLKSVLFPHVSTLLARGQHVVLDFPGNTFAQRSWFKQIVDESGSPHTLIHLIKTDEVCLGQIALRRLQEPERAATDTLEMFNAVNSHFVAPTDDEGLNVMNCTHWHDDMFSALGAKP